MFTLERRKYFDWILSAVAGTSLVVLMFYASETEKLSPAKVWSAAMLVAAIPFGISALLLSKEAELYKKNELDSVDGGHAVLFLLSISFFLIGFLIFIHAISSVLSVTFSVAGIFSILVYLKVRKKILGNS